MARRYLHPRVRGATQADRRNWRRRAAILQPAGYSAEATEALSYLSSPTQLESDEIAAFVDREVSAGRWDLTKEFFPYFLSNESDALTSIRTGNTGILGAGATHYSPDGIQTITGGSGWIGTGYMMSVEPALVDNHIMGAFVRAHEATSGTNRSILGAVGAAYDAYGWYDFTAGNMRLRYQRASGGASWSHTPADNQLYVMGRIDNGRQYTWVDGVSLGTGEFVTPTDNPETFVLVGNRGGSNTANNSMAGVYSCFFAAEGAGFSQSEFNTSLTTMLTNVGTINSKWQAPLVVGDSWTNDTGDWPAFLKRKPRTKLVITDHAAPDSDTVNYTCRAGERITDGDPGRGIESRTGDWLVTYGGDADSFILMAGINDFQNGVSFEDVRDTIIDLDVWLDFYSNIEDRIYCLAQPTSFYTSGEVDEWEEYNTWLTSWCATKGYGVIDTPRLIGDPSDGYSSILPAYQASGDPLHVNTTGRNILADAIDALMLARSLT